MADEQTKSQRLDIEQVKDAAAALLRLPFRRALELSAKLRQYIQKQEHPELVEEEFRGAWVENADILLVEILSQILSEEDDVSIMAIFASIATLPPQRERLAQRSEELGDGIDSSALGLRSKGNFFTDAPGYGTVEWGGWLPGEFGAPPTETVEDLLRIPFGDAINLSKELREYLADLEDGPRVEAEFREDWGPQASEHLRTVLAQILSPEFKLLHEKRDSEWGEPQMEQAKVDNGSINATRAVAGGMNPQTRRSKHESKL